MPELPEVETVVRKLGPLLVGQTVTQVSVAWPKLVAVPDPDTFVEVLPGLTLGKVRRRGKYILVDAGPQVMIVHLRMTGNLLVSDVCANEPLNDKHVHLIMHFASGRQLCYRDMRKFGRFWLVDDPAMVVGALGPEPLDEALTADRFTDLLRGYRRQLKPALLDQHVIAGLGNIYVDETLWHAELHPLRHTDALSDKEARRLYHAMREVLGQAIANGGTTLRDYRNPENEPGHHQLALAVYHRQGQACPRCGTEIERSQVAQRGTHFCPSCQASGA